MEANNMLMHKSITHITVLFNTNTFFPASQLFKLTLFFHLKCVRINLNLLYGVITVQEDIYESPFSSRYASKNMQKLFSERHRALLWRKLWVFLAEAEHDLGLPVTREQVEELKAHQDKVDLDQCHQYERQTRHDVMAHIHAYADECPLAAPIIHLGATSCYVGDNSDIMIYRDGLMLLEARICSVLKNLSLFAKKYAGLPTLAYTHFQPAQPTTVGKRASLWIQDLASDLEEIDFVLDNLKPLGCKGTTGTQASFLELFHGNRSKVFELDHMITERMGFKDSVAVSGQTYPRKQDARILNALAQVAASAQKFSTDLRLLQHEKEIEEPFESTQVGSSAMPYKRNPMRSERITGLSRFLIGNAHNGLTTAAEQWLERSLDDSANRRLSMAEGFLCADGILMLYENVTSNLTVNEQVIARHLKTELPFMASENLLMKAVEKGGNRQQLHEIIRQTSMTAGQRIKQEGRECDLLERLASDPDFPLNQEEIFQTVSPTAFIGLAAKQTEIFLDDVVNPILEKHKDLPDPEGEISL